MSAPNFIVEDNQLTSAAKDELQLVLSFFARVESKSSVVLAIDTAMIAFLASNAPTFSTFSICVWLIAGTAITLLALSILMLYLGAFPNLKGGEASLIYFRQIAQRKEQTFIEEFSNLTPQQYAHDLLAQAFRNSQILTAKFDYLKRAFIFMALAIFPWLVSLVIFAAHNGGAHPKP